MLGVIVDLLTWLWGKIKWVLLIGMPFMALIAFIQDGVSMLTGGIEDLTTRVYDLRMIVTTSMEPVAPYMGYANSFFPLTEIFAMAAIWAGVKVTIVVIRLIKGCLPTYG